MSQRISRTLGETFEKNGTSWRVVRFTKQTSLCETEAGVLSVIDEDLIQLKSSEGKIDFEVLSSEIHPYEGPGSSIKAPEPINWKKE